MLIYFVLIAFVAVIASQIRSFDEPYFYETKGGLIHIGHLSRAKTMYIIFAIVLACIAGLRYNVGADFDAYYNGVAGRAADLAENLKKFKEPGIDLICWIAARISPSDPRATGIFLEASITVFLMLYSIYKNSDDLPFAIVLYLFLVWSSCFNGVRQSLAAAIVFLGLPFIRERKLVRYSIIILFAALFHKSAFVMLPVYFIAGRKATIRNMFVILVGSFIILYSYDKVFHLLGNVLDDVDNTEYAHRSVNILRTVVACAPAVVFWGNGLHSDADEETAFYLNITLVHAALALAASGSAYFARASMFVDPFIVIAIPKLCRRLGTSTRMTVVSLMKVFYALFWLYGRYSDRTEKVFQFIWQR